MAKTTVTARAGRRMLHGETQTLLNTIRSGIFVHVLTIIDFNQPGVLFVTMINITAAGYVTGMPVQIRINASVFKGNFQVPVIPVSTGTSNEVF